MAAALHAWQTLARVLYAKRQYHGILPDPRAVLKYICLAKHIVVGFFAHSRYGIGEREGNSSLLKQPNLPNRSRMDKREQAIGRIRVGKYYVCNMGTSEEFGRLCPDQRTLQWVSICEPVVNG